MTASGLQSKMLLGAIVLASPVVLSGCTAATETPVASAPPAPAAEPTAPPAPTIEPGTVVATGVLDGQVAGKVAVVATPGGKFEVHIDQIETQLNGQFTAYFSTQPYVLGGHCDNPFPMHGYGQAEMVSSYSFVLGGFAFGDATLLDPAYIANPDFLDDLVLTASRSNSLEDCFYPVVALAPLTWTLPDMRPDLKAADSGTTGGATGTVQTVDGRLRSYQVASGDVLAEIAARFGIQVADLFYLNPARSPNSEDPMAYAGEVLNLDKASR